MIFSFTVYYLLNIYFIKFQSCANLHNNQYDLALYHSKKAIELAESAFFDPTMVSMLYFPDEHKYAIYMPLFVPISVPLLVALHREVKKFRKNNI